MAPPSAVPADTAPKHEPGVDRNDAFATLHVDPTPDSGRLCLVVREMYEGASVAFVELAYANGGKLAKRERWSVPRSGDPKVRAWTRTYQWRGNRLASWDGGSGPVNYEYDARGLPTKIEAIAVNNSGVYTRVDLRWDVRPVARASPATFALRASAQDPLPWYLPYQGTVRIERVQGKIAPVRSAGTFVYDANGVLSLPKWKYAATGEPLGYDEVTWTWEGRRHVEKSWVTRPLPHTGVVNRGRVTFEYDDQNRLKRKVQYEVRGSDAKLEHEVRYSHLCEGSFIEDPIWP